MPISTGKPYRGIKQLILQILAIKHDDQSRWFGTLNHIKQAGASVKKGSRSIKVILWKPISRDRKNEKGEDGEDQFRH